MLYLYKFRCLHHMLIICLLIFAGINQLKVASATTPELDLEPIPQLCDPIQCPADADMQCPEDSAIREIREINAVDLISTNGGNSGNTGSSANDTNASSLYNNSLVVPDELFAQCCLSKKCVCKTCYIPDCNTDDGEVVVELQPEAMDTPGQCCGQYECKKEPNCTEVRDTEYYWLQSCQRCLCTSGARICQQSCDEGATNAICESKNLNAFFKDGESWEDGCYQCECVKGEQKCVIPFCGHVNCPSERQVTLKDSCCPVCWPKGEPMPHEKPHNYDDGYGYEREEQPNNETDKDETGETTIISSTSSSSTSTTTSTTTQRIAELNAYATGNSPTAPPCRVQDFPNVVEVVHPTTNFNEYFYYIIMGILVIVIAGLCFYISHLRAKQRSYRPVSISDEKA